MVCHTQVAANLAGSLAHVAVLVVHNKLDVWLGFVGKYRSIAPNDPAAAQQYRTPLAWMLAV